jgi:hypothetical protein
VSDWRIRRREERCGGCERTFLEGEGIFSLLFVEADGLRREDVCPACFEGRSPGSELLFWRTRHRRGRSRALAVDFEALEELFLALAGRAEERLAELRYLLALLLLRKKRLKLLGMRTSEGTSTMALARPRREEELEVAVFDLTPERIQALREDLTRIFAGAGIEALLAGPTAEASAPLEVADDAGGAEQARS